MMKRVYVALVLLFVSGLGWCEEGQWLPFGRGIPVLLYHGITKELDANAIYEISESSFRSHMQALKQAGFTTLTIDDVLGYFHQKKLIPQKSVLITFDDGEKTSFYRTDDILKEMGFHAVMFVIPLMQVDQFPAYLSWEELNQMFKSGRWDIQAHGYNYHNIIPIDEKGEKGNFASNLMWLKEQNRIETIEEYRDRLKVDLRKQKKILEERVQGTNVIAFAYPFGDIGDSAINLDAKLATAINVTAVDAVFPLSFGTVYLEAESYTTNSSPHLINRLIDDERIEPGQLIELLQKLTQ